MSDSSGGEPQVNIDSLAGAAMAIQSVRHSAEPGLTDTELRRLAAAEDFLASYTDDIGGAEDE